MPGYFQTLYPQHVKLCEEEKSNICYLSFPDSNSGCMGDTQFHFRIRYSYSKTDKLCSRVSKLYNKTCPPALQTDLKFIYGYVYFRQVKDPSLRRGYFQKVAWNICTTFNNVRLSKVILSISTWIYCSHFSQLWSWRGFRLGIFFNNVWRFWLHHFSKMV